MKIKAVAPPAFPLLLSIAVFAASVGLANAQTAAFTYQGRLTDGGAPANGIYDLRFQLYNVATGGSPLGGGAVTNENTLVSNGLAGVTLNFGASIFYNGWDRWLEVAVRTNGAGAFVPLTPRQRITPTPYALTAYNVIGVVPGDSLAGVYPNPVTFSNNANTFVGNGSGLVDVNATRLDGMSGSNFWQVGGNRGTRPGIDFIGTADDQPLELRVNGQRALRIERSTNGTPNIIAGGQNLVAVGAASATVGGGWFNTIESAAHESTIGGGGVNKIQTGARMGTISGGYLNAIRTNALRSTIGGGYVNTIQTDASDSTISGGYQNTIEIGAPQSTIGGGGYNVIQSNGIASTIGGGNSNFIQHNAGGATIGGGIRNTIQSNTSLSTISGGYENTIQAAAVRCTIGGGYNNTNGGFDATIPGGRDNVAVGDYSFAAGRGAKALHSGAFVWGDGIEGNVASQRDNQFTIRATGGVTIFSTGTLESGPGVELAPNGNSWSSISDRNAKKNLQPVNKQEILEKVAQLPVQRWHYKGDSDSDVPHIGPMAQDFKAAFYPGRDDTRISTMEFDGVELAAIQGLNEKLEEEAKAKDAKIATLEKRLQELERLVNAIGQPIVSKSAN